MSNSGFRKPKKLTAKQMQDEMARIQMENARLESMNTMLLLTERDNAAMFITYIQMYDGIMKATLETAGSVGEARRWYQAWSKDIGELQNKELVGNEFLDAVAEINKKHNYEIEVQMHHQAIDKVRDETENRYLKAG